VTQALSEATFRREEILTKWKKRLRGRKNEQYGAEIPDYGRVISALGAGLLIARGFSIDLAALIVVGLVLLGLGKR
jgi:hypothetical protein